MLKILTQMSRKERLGIAAIASSMVLIPVIEIFNNYGISLMAIIYFLIAWRISYE